MSDVIEDNQVNIEDSGDAKKSTDLVDKINELKQLALKSEQVQASYDYVAFRLEKMAEAEKEGFYERRSEIVREMLKTPTGDGPGPQKPIYFWLSVLKSSDLRYIITKDDEPILKHLYDVRSTVCPDDPQMNFVLEFYFEPNVYFTNKKLFKAYFTRPLTEWRNPLKYEGYKIDRCTGCTIDWTIPEAARRKQTCLSFWSFFDFFQPPVIPDDVDEYSKDDIRMRKRVLLQTYHIGCYFKEHLIPKALLYFTESVPEEPESDFDEYDFFESDEDTDDDDGDDERDSN